MTYTPTDTTNADLRKLVEAQKLAMRKIIAAQSEATDKMIAERDELISVALDRVNEIAHLESDLRTWRVLFVIVLGYAVGMTFAFIGRCG